MKPSASSTDGLDYGSVGYWNVRYSKQQDKTFDWVDTFDEVRPIFEEHVLQPLFQRYQAE